MRFERHTISNQRLQQIHCWALLWLAWLAVQLEKVAPSLPFAPDLRAAAQCWLDSLERLVVGLAIIHLAERVRRRTRGQHPHRTPMRRPAAIRAIVGGRLRRALRPKDICARIAALRQDMDALVSRLLRRLPFGLTRCSTIVCPEFSAPPRIIADAPFAPCLNTS